MVSLADVARALKDVKGSATSFTALCPAHEDERRSLSVGKGRDGRVLLKCHARCRPADIARALGWSLSDLSPDRRHEITYDYVDERGILLYQVVRQEPKDFKCRVPDGRGGWTWKMQGVRRVLYRTPDLISAIASSRWVLITEGEKDCENLILAGFTATTNPHGAGKWRSAFAQQLRGARVAILPDNDDAGVEHARSVAASLEGIAADVRVVLLPELPPKGDVSDWLGAGHSAEELRALINEAPVASGFTWPRPPAELNPQSIGLQDVSDSRPVFRIRPDLTGMTEETLEALAARDDLGVFTRGRMLVTVAAESTTGRDRKWLERPDEAPVFLPMTEPRLLAAIDRAARWERLDERKKAPKAAMPPAWLATQIVARTSWPLRPLAGVIGAPTLRPDGSVLDQQGYDESTGLYYAAVADSPAWPGVSARPTKADAQAAVRRLLEPFSDFPFVGPSDQATVVAAVLTLLARHLIDGPTPLFAVSAPAPGTGKGLVVKVIGMMATGRDSDMMTMADADELRKRVTALALDGTPAVVLDNVSGTLGSDLLAAVLTRTTWEDRVLGRSEQISLPLKTVWFATGNNIAFQRTLGRRALLIELDAQLENPEDRVRFRYPDLPAHVRTHRLSYVAAALTVLRAFYLAGRPSHGKARMGSYEAWDDVVRSAVVWAGLADFAAADVSDSGRSRIRTDADQDAEALSTVLSKLAAQYSGIEFTAAEVMIQVERDPELRHAIQAVAGDKQTSVTAQSLPYALRSIVRRPAGGLRLDYGGAKRRPRRYVVRDGATILDDSSNPSRTIRQEEQREGVTDQSETAGSIVHDRSIVPTQQNGHRSEESSGVLRLPDGSEAFTQERIDELQAERRARRAQQEPA